MRGRDALDRGSVQSGVLHDERGFTLLETVASFALLAVLAMLAYGLIQAADHMMRYGSERASIGQATQAAVEHIKDMARAGQMPLGCDGPGGSVATVAGYEAIYTCFTGPAGIQDLVSVDVRIQKAGTGDTVGSYVFYVTRGVTDAPDCAG